MPKSIMKPAAIALNSAEAVAIILTDAEKQLRLIAMPGAIRLARETARASAATSLQDRGKRVEAAQGRECSEKGTATSGRDPPLELRRTTRGEA